MNISKTTFIKTRKSLVYGYYKVVENVIYDCTINIDVYL